MIPPSQQSLTPELDDLQKSLTNSTSVNTLTSVNTFYSESYVTKLQILFFNIPVQNL